MASDTILQVYTTAPAAYDGFSTRQCGTVGETCGKPVRLVEIEERDYQWQTMRYGSGMHASRSPAEWAELVAAGLATETTAAEPIRAAADRRREDERRRVGDEAYRKSCAVALAIAAKSVELAKPANPAAGSEGQLEAAALAVFNSVERVEQGIWQVPHAAFCQLIEALRDRGAV